MADANRVYIFDTTLRDAEQTPGASLTVKEKLEVAHQLARLKVDIIEAGFPVSSNEDFEAVRCIGQEIEGPVICGLSRAVPKDIERAGAALHDAPRPRIHTFIGTSDIHLAGQLRKGREEVLKMAVAAVEQAKSYCDDVEFSPHGRCAHRAQLPQRNYRGDHCGGSDDDQHSRHRGLCRTRRIWGANRTDHRQGPQQWRTPSLASTATTIWAWR